MGLHNRPYMGENDSGQERGAWSGGNIRLGLPRPTPAVLVLMGLCLVVVLLTLLTGRGNSSLYSMLALYPSNGWEVWRFITFQFVHGGASHFMWNMVGLYFFGPALERAWGWRRFTLFYLVCGAFAGLSFVGLMHAMSQWSSLVGASGGILALVMATAILFPEVRFIVFPIRWVAGFLFVLYLLSMAFGEDWGDAAHLGGMVAAGIWIALTPRVENAFLKRRLNPNKGTWKRRMDKMAAEQAEIDRILKKIHDKGITSLTHHEKKLLHDATRRQQKQEQEAGRL